MTKIGFKVILYKDHGCDICLFLLDVLIQIL